MLRQSGWEETVFCHKICIFGFHLLEAILKVRMSLRMVSRSESQIYIFSDKK